MPATPTPTARPSRWWRYATVLVAVALAAAACGDDAGDPVTSPDAGDPPATTAGGAADTTTVDATVSRSTADPNAPTALWVTGVNEAGWAFHRTLEGNAVSSPLSIGTAFSFARAGASPDTGARLDAAFGFPEGEGTHTAANAVGLVLAEASTGTTTLEVANRLFPDVDFEPDQDFVDTGAAHYGAGLQPVDMADAAGAAEDVNGWVEERTRGLIPTIVDPSMLADLELVLVNTVYLQADWSQPFVPELTEDAEFVTATGPVLTPFMGFVEPMPLRHVALDGADAVELPYADGDLAMWLVVPSETDGLADVEAGLTAADLTDLPERSTSVSVDLTMPAFESELPVTDLLGTWLCAEHDLCPGAAFEGIAPDIVLDVAVHGARIVVDEKGTEAAAATALGFEESGPPPADVTIAADRPFLYSILHEPTGTLLFVGRLVDPTVV